VVGDLRPLKKMLKNALGVLDKKIKQKYYIKK